MTENVLFYANKILLKQGMINSQLKKRVVIVDETEFAQVCKFLLESTSLCKVVSVYPSMEETIQNLKNDKPDLVITEIELRDMNGVEGISQLRKLYPSVDIIICTNLCNLEIVLEAFAVGAGGYLIKDESLDRLNTYVQDIVRGGGSISPTVARTLIGSYKRNPASPLSFRETEVVRLLAKGNTYSQIASSLKISNETSKTHIKNIYKKLSVSSKSLALKRVMEERFI